MNRVRLVFVGAVVCAYFWFSCGRAPNSRSTDESDLQNILTGSGEALPDDATPDRVSDDAISPASADEAVAEGLPCISCHQYALGERRPAVTESGEGGHDFGAGSLTNEACKICHDLSEHQGGTVRLWANPGSVDDAIVLTDNPRSNTESAGRLVSFCSTCHGALVHGGHPVRGDWQPTCVACHDLHDPGSVNLALIGTFITPASTGQAITENCTSCFSR